jgi:transketolase
MLPLYEDHLRVLEETAYLIREDVVRMVVRAGSGHVGGALGMADVFTALYFHILRHRPHEPHWHERDRVVLSNGHICPVLYSTLARAGYFPLEELATLRQINSRLQGHPHRSALPGLETTSGPLGSGLSQALGMALGLSLDGSRSRVYVLLSDGEQQEGNTWEAVMAAARYRAGNLTAILDRNHIQIDGYTEDVMPLEPLKDKYIAFGWNVIEIDGHSFHGIVDACAEAEAIYDRPTLIIAHTIPGRGVSYMEHDYHWHSDAPGSKDVPGAPPKYDQVSIALADLKAARERLHQGYRHTS